MVRSITVRLIWCESDIQPDSIHVHLKGVTMHKSRVTLKSSQIRKNNIFLKNWANQQESDNLHDLLKSHIINTMGNIGEKVVLKGTVKW